MEKEPLYKKATVEDIEDLVSSRIQVLRTVFHIDEAENMAEIGEASFQYYAKALSDGSHTAYLVYVGDQVIGTGGICYDRVMPMPYNHSGNRGYIMNMYTDKAYRGRGIAGKVLELLLADARERGIFRVSLSATEQGRPVYERYGFTEDKAAMLSGAY